MQQPLVALRQTGQRPGNLIGIDLLPSLSVLGRCRLRRKGRGFLVVAFQVPASQPVALGDSTSGLTQAPQA